MKSKMSGYEAMDMKADKKKGIKEDSKKDKMMDKKPITKKKK